MLLVYFQFLTIYIWSAAPQETRFLELLRQDRNPMIEKKLFEQKVRSRFQKQCRYELSEDLIPFSCYRFKSNKIVDQQCIKNSHKLEEQDFNKIRWVSKACKPYLVEKKDKLLYIKASEAPEEVVFSK